MKDSSTNKPEISEKQPTDFWLDMHLNTQEAERKRSGLLYDILGITPDPYQVDALLMLIESFAQAAKEWDASVKNVNCPEDLAWNYQHEIFFRFSPTFQPAVDAYMDYLRAGVMDYNDTLKDFEEKKRRFYIGAHIMRDHRQSPGEIDLAAWAAQPAAANVPLEAAILTVLEHDNTPDALRDVITNELSKHAVPVDHECETPELVLAWVKDCIAKSSATEWGRHEKAVSVTVYGVWNRLQKLYQGPTYPTMSKAVESIPANLRKDFDIHVITDGKVDDSLEWHVYGERPPQENDRTALQTLLDGGYTSLAELLSQVMNHPDLPTRVYDAIGDELNDMEMEGRPKPDTVQGIEEYLRHAKNAPDEEPRRSSVSALLYRAMKHEDLPARIYNVLADELTAGVEVDPGYIERSLQAVREREATND